MTNSFTDEDKLLVLRSMIGEYEENEFHMPVIRRIAIDNVDWNNLRLISYKSISAKTSLENYLVTMFSFDKNLARLWNNPLKVVPLYQTARFISTPDFSVYSNMNYNELRHNVFRNRWLGVIWQNYRCKVLPTIQWCSPDTYDLCFGAIEERCSVIISTVGCKNNQKVFLQGFDEMKRRINPDLIIVYGNMIPGMTGRFVNFKLTDTFCPKVNCVQESFFDKVFTI